MAKAYYQLIVLDMYGTIVCIDNSSPRNGLQSFVKNYARLPMVLATDDTDTARIQRNLRAINLEDKVVRVYTGQDMVKRDFGPTSIWVKDLERIAREFGVPIERVVFIGDALDKRDLVSAWATWSADEDLKKGASFVHVPLYHEENEKFSFDMIDLSRRLPVQHLKVPFSYSDGDTIEDLIIVMDMRYLDLRAVNNQS